MPDRDAIGHGSRSPARALARFRSGTGGAAAVEFALVAMPFLALVGAVFQSAFQLWAGNNFDRAVQNGVRTVLTGQFQQTNAGATSADALKALKIAICGTADAPIASVFVCQNIKIDVSIFSSFGGSSASSPVDKTTGTWTTGFGTNYAAAQACTITVVTVAVPFPSLFNLAGLNMKRFTSGTEAGSALLMSTAVFKTEPYQVAGTTSC